MNSKLNIQELAEQIAKELDMSVDESNMFLDAMFLLINESLLRKEEVKIKGIGVFKLTLVDKRESVDVNTGERIEIPQHYKVVFAPDSQFKEAVNKPFSIFDTIDLSDDANEVVLETHELELLDKVENEASVVSLMRDKDDAKSVDLKLCNLGEKEQPGDDLLIVRSNCKIESLVNAEDFTPSILFAEASVDRGASDEINSSLHESETFVSPEESVMYEDIQTKSSGEVDDIDEKHHDVLGDQTLEANEMPRLIHEAILAAKSEWTRDQCQEKQLLPCEASKTINADEHTCNYPRSGSFSISLLILLAGFAMGGMCVYCYFLRQSIFEQSFLTNEGGSREVVLALVDEPTPDVSKLSLTDTIVNVKQDTSSIHLEEVPMKSNSEIQQSQDELVVEKDLPEKIKLKSGMRLARLAEQYYGNKVFWVYIYEENKDVIKNPNILPVGVVVNIPPRSKYSIDDNDSVSLNNAKKLQSKLLGRFD